MSGTTTVAAVAALLNVKVNGQPQSMPVGSTLAELVDALSLAPESIATAVNGEFIARHRRALQPLQTGDSVGFFQAIVGG